MASVLVIGEVDGGSLTAGTAELLGAATRLSADLGGGVACALIGAGVAAAADAAIAAGADTVYVAEHEGLAQYQTETYVPVAAAIAEQDGPKVVLLGQTSIGRDLAPRLATRLESAGAMDALSIEVEGDRVKATRSSYGGNARQVVTVRTDPQVITVRAKSQEPLAEDAGRSGKVETVAVELADAKATLSGKDQAESEGVKLEDAEIGGAVGASRAACDLGWYPPSQQVGLTGTVVSPTMYVAIAISGASQHMAGCGGAKNIVAINKDPDANIFRFSRFGIVDDYKKVLPALEEELKKAFG